MALEGVVDALGPGVKLTPKRRAFIVERASALLGRKA
jgi:hypothetical protein